MHRESSIFEKTGYNEDQGVIIKQLIEADVNKSQRGSSDHLEETQNNSSLLLQSAFKSAFKRQL